MKNFNWNFDWKWNFIYNFLKFFLNYSSNIFYISESHTCCTYMNFNLRESWMYVRTFYYVRCFWSDRNTFQKSEDAEG